MALTAGTFYDLPRALIDTIQHGNLPYENVINPLVYQVGAGIVPSIPAPEDQEMITLVGTALDLLSDPWMSATLTLLGVVIATAICMPLCGYCYFKMRKKGNCLASQHITIASHPGFRVKYSVMLILMFFFGSFLLAGIALGIASNVHLSSAVGNLTSSADSSFQSSLDFVRRTLEESRNVTDDELTATLDSVNADIRNIKEVLGAIIGEKLAPVYQQLASSLESFAEYFDISFNNFMEIDDALLDVLSSTSQLDRHLIKVQEHMERFDDACDAKRICEEGIPVTAIANIRSELENLVSTTLFSVLTPTNVVNVRDQLYSTSESLPMITELIADKFRDKGVITHSSPYNSTLDKVQKAIMRISSGYYLDLVVAYFQRLEYYLVSASYLVFLVISGVLCAYVAATLIGLAGYRTDIQYGAQYRTSTSNAGAKIMIWVITVSFPVCGVLTFSTTFLYLPSTLGQKLCNDFSPPDYVFLANSIDNKELWNGNTFATLAGKFEDTLDFSASDFLSHCGKDETFYTALQVNQSFDTEIEKIYAAVKLDSNILGNLTFEDLIGPATDKIVTKENIAMLEKLPQYIISTVDAEDRIAMVGMNNLQEKYTEALDAFEEFAVVFKSLDLESPYYDDVGRYVFLRVELKIGILVGAINGRLNALREKLTEVSREGAVNIHQAISEFKTQATPAVLEGFEDFYDQLASPIIDYEARLQDVIGNRIGKCEPLATAYNEVHYAMCRRVLDGMNGVWCGVLWCVCSILILIMCGTFAIVFFKRDTETPKSFIHEAQLNAMKKPIGSRRGTLFKDGKAGRKATLTGLEIENTLVGQGPKRMVTGCVSGISGLFGHIPNTHKKHKRRHK